MRSIEVVKSLPDISTSLIEIADLPREIIRPDQTQLIAARAELVGAAVLADQDVQAVKVMSDHQTVYARSFLDELDYTKVELETCLAALYRLSYYAHLLSDREKRKFGREIRPFAQRAIYTATAVSVIYIDDKQAICKARTLEERYNHVRSHLNSYLVLRPLMKSEQREQILYPVAPRNRRSLGLRAPAPSNV